MNNINYYFKTLGKLVITLTPIKRKSGINSEAPPCSFFI